MSMEFANRICPNCWNPNYVVFLGDFSKAYKYKCMNCNHYFNDIDVDEPSAPVWKSEWMNKKVDMVEVVRCKDCKFSQFMHDRFTDEYICLKNMDGCGMIPEEDSKGHRADWFCADGRRK